MLVCGLVSLRFAHRSVATLLVVYHFHKSFCLDAHLIPLEAEHREILEVRLKLSIELFDGLVLIGFQLLLYNVHVQVLPQHDELIITVVTGVVLEPHKKWNDIRLALQLS